VSDDKKPSSLLDYETWFIGGSARMRVFLYHNYTIEDLQDFRDWMGLIDRQMARRQAALRDMVETSADDDQPNLSAMASGDSEK
jgi:hypothetical protein